MTSTVQYFLEHKYRYMSNTKELNQLPVCQALLPKKEEDRSRMKALRYLMFLKENLDNRLCTDGRSQREYMSKEATSFPTVSFKAMMISCATDAWEG